MKETTDFLHTSICDIQSTIRAVDVKAGFLFLMLFTPLYSMDKLAPLLTCVFVESRLHSALIITFILSWILAITCAFMAIAAISNPANKVTGAKKCMGSFYGGDLYNLTIFDVFYNFRNTSNRTVDEEIDILPKNEGDTIAELTFEKLKLTYIRDIKLCRINFCIKVTAAWLLIGALTYIIHICGKLPC